MFYDAGLRVSGRFEGGVPFLDSPHEGRRAGLCVLEGHHVISMAGMGLFEFPRLAPDQ